LLQPAALVLRLTWRGVIKRSMPALHGRKGREIVIANSDYMANYMVFSC